MKIAYLMHGLGFGGAGTSLYLLIKSLKNYSYEKFLYTSHITFIDALNDYMKYCKSFEIINAERIYNDMAGGRTTIKRFNKIVNKKFPELINSLNKRQIDILHINSSVFPHLLSQIKNETKCKIVTHVREMLPQYGKGEVRDYMIKQINTHSDAIICISDNEAPPFCIHNNMYILANPFDTGVVDGIEGNLRKEYNISNEDILVGTAGKFAKSKGQLEFLKSIKYLLDNYSHMQTIKFIIMGYYKFNPLWKVALKRVLQRNDYGYDIKKFLSKNNLREHVILLPYTYNFFNYLIDIDIMVRPALSADPWGRDIIESMAFGKPVIATGKSEFYIKDALSGYLVPPNRPAKIADKMNALITNEKLRLRLGKKGREIIKEKCNLKQYGENIHSVYQSVLK